MRTVTPIAIDGSPNGHQLIGYWTGTFPLHEIFAAVGRHVVSFADPGGNAPEGTLQFHLDAGLDTEQFKSNIACLRSQGKKVMISLGGGGRYFTLNNPASIPIFRLISDRNRHPI